MILYFSATGNSKYVAEKIAKDLNDKAVSIISIKDKKINVNDEYFGVVLPTCFWSMPLIVKEFFSNIDLKVSSYTYNFIVVTYGSFTGTNGKDLQRILEKKNIHIYSKYSIKMPDSWTPIFDLSDNNKNNKLLKSAENDLDDILNKLNGKANGDYIKNKFPRIITIICKPLYDYYRNTKNFKVNDKCIGCGLCKNKCPNNAIDIINERPVWVKEKCTLCLGCMHRCPKSAIEYRKSAKHGQYTNPNTKL